MDLVSVYLCCVSCHNTFRCCVLVVKNIQMLQILFSHIWEERFPATVLMISPLDWLSLIKQTMDFCFSLQNRSCWYRLSVQVVNRFDARWVSSSSCFIRLSLISFSILSLQIAFLQGSFYKIDIFSCSGSCSLSSLWRKFWHGLFKKNVIIFCCQNSHIYSWLSNVKLYCCPQLFASAFNEGWYGLYTPYKYSNACNWNVRSEKWNVFNCPCRFCKTYVHDVGIIGG